MSEDQKKQNPPQRSNAYMKYLGMTAQMGAVISLGAWGGVQLDKHYQLTTPIFTIVLCLLGVGIALYLVLKDFIGK